MSIENFDNSFDDDPYNREKGAELFRQSVLPRKNNISLQNNINYYLIDDDEIAEQVHAAAAAQDGFARWILATKGIEEAWDLETHTMIEDMRARNNFGDVRRKLRGVGETHIDLEQLEAQSIGELDESIRAIAGALAIASMQD